MSSFLAFTLLGLVMGSGYAVAASGLVLTYTTSKVFNIAHGAVGMVLAFLFWQLGVDWGLPTWLALLLTVLVIAPLLGVVMERLVMRRLVDAPVSVSLVVTVGLVVGLIGAAQAIWPPTGRPVEPFFASATGVTVVDVTISVHDLITMAVAIAVAAGLYLMLNRTRMGIAMRAAVDNRGLLALHGGRPTVVSAMAWAVGFSLAALAGILLTPYVQLEYYDLTLLVINAYAAAMLGRLKSLPMTFVGALILGLLQSYAVGYLPSTGSFTGLRAAIPTIFLFAVLLLMPQVRLRVGQVKGIVAVPVPSMRRALVAGGAFVLVMSLIAPLISAERGGQLAMALVYGIVMLSLVLLTGYGGYVSLAQFTFVGVGALTVAKLGSGSLTSIGTAGLVAAGVGALVAIPVLRLTGLYLALSTLAFAQLMDKLVFQSELGFTYEGSLQAARLTVLGMEIRTEQAYVVVLAMIFTGLALGLLAVRRGRIGRLLIAMRDSPAACGTLGLNQPFMRVALFAGSAAVAGIAGGLFAGLQGTVVAADFTLFNSLPLLLLAVVGGVTSVTGAAVGGTLLMLLPVMQAQFPELGGLLFLVIGLAAVGLGSDPNGLASRLFRVGRFAVTGAGRVRRRPTARDEGVADEVDEAPTKEMAVHAAS